jgi:hypothetical protein
MRRHLEIFLKFTRATGHPQPHLKDAFVNYAGLLQAMGRSEAEVKQILADVAARCGQKPS